MKYSELLQRYPEMREPCPLTNCLAQPMEQCVENTFFGETHIIVPHIERLKAWREKEALEVLAGWAGLL